MALANFFDKAALAVAQALGRFDTAALEQRLGRSVPGLVFGPESMTAEGRISTELIINLLARFYPRIAVSAAGAELADRLQELRLLAREINPEIEVSGSTNEAGMILAVGAPRVDHKAPVLYLGSDGWTTRLNPSMPVGCGITSAPFGAAVAACIAVANVFRHFFQDQLEGGELDGPIELSLLSLKSGQEERAVPPPRDAHIGEWHLVGSGAVGSAALWALKRTAVHGTVHVVDHEPIELSNLQRYLLFGQRDVGCSKAEAAEALFRESRLRVHAHRQRWGEYLQSRDDWNLPRVAVALDSASDRIAVQGALPMRTLNAWTQRGELGVSRHRFPGNEACLACLYLPTHKTRNEDELVADALGLPSALMEIRELLYRGAPVSRGLLDRAAGALSIPVEPLLRFEGKPLRVLYSEGICGGVVLSLRGSQQSHGDRGTETPLAFQSALAGVLLAAEMVLDSNGVRPDGFPTRTSINLLKPVAPEISFYDRKVPGRKCICQDEDYVSAYRSKYGS